MRNKKFKHENKAGRALLNKQIAPNPMMSTDESIKHTIEMQQVSATRLRNFQSITQESDLDGFLTTAQLAGTEFAAERLNLQLIERNLLGFGKNRFLLDTDEHCAIVNLHEEYKDKLTIPRRPAWNQSTTAEDLKKAEREAFLEWRRSLVVLEETLELLMTPYERNLEVWRQLWRVIERSDLIVQIVDARNPLLFRSTDIEVYAKEIDCRKKNLLLVNKADMLSDTQRLAWAKYFISKGIDYRFFSAALAKKLQDEFKAKGQALEAVQSTAAQRVADQLAVEILPETSIPKDDPMHGSHDELSPAAPEYALSESEQEAIKIMSVDEFLELFMKECPKPLRKGETKSTIGFIGYPNVGKSSTLNALAGAKCVAVASTPGKTKHFQTIHLPPLPIILCDCPGLVFPSFASTKADMVTNGILPIDHLREPTGPSALVAQRIPKLVLEKAYGIRIHTRDAEGALVEDRAPTAEEFLRSYALSRGYTKSSQGNPDEARAARYILKDYVAGKLLFAFPPPHINAHLFNRQTYLNFLASPARISMVSSLLLSQSDITREKEAAYLEIRDIDPETLYGKSNETLQLEKLKATAEPRIANVPFERSDTFLHQKWLDANAGSAPSSVHAVSSGARQKLGKKKLRSLKHF